MCSCRVVLLFTWFAFVSGMSLFNLAYFLVFALMELF